jgi:outer membrane protein
MQRWKKNRWGRLPLFLLMLSGWICPGGLSAQEGLPDSRAASAAELGPALTLADVIDLALRDNRNLLSSAYGVEGRQLSVEAAQSEFEWKLFPQATASASDETRSLGGGVTVEKKFSPGPIASVSPEIVRNYDSDSDETYSSVLGVSLTMPLLRGLGTEVNLNGVRTAEYSLRTARRSHYLVKVNTVLEAVAAVYNIVQQRELVHMYGDQAQRFFGHVVMARAREKIGLATPIDVYRAQIRLKDIQDSLNRSQEALRNAGDRLKIVLATPLEQALEVVAPLECQPVDISGVQALETALQHRVELKQVNDDMAEAKRASRLSKNDLLPQLDMVANYTRLGNDDAFAGATKLSEELWSVNLVSTTDWSRTAEKATYRQSLLAIKQVELNRAARIDSIKREVRQFYDALQKASERMQIRKDQIDQAAGKLALAKIKFSHGMADNFDLIEAETELQEARSNLLAAQVEYIVGMYRLRAAIGTLIES